MDELKICIKKAKTQNIPQTEIISLVGQIYNPLTSSAFKIVSPYAKKAAASGFTSAAKKFGSKGGISKKNKKSKKNKSRRNK